MPSPVWSNAIQKCADPQRASNYVQKLLVLPEGASLSSPTSEQAVLLCNLFSGSPAMSDLLLAHPEWLGEHVLEPDYLRHPRQLQGLRRECHQLMEPLLKDRNFASALSHLRLFKQREMLRIAMRDLGRLSHAREITEEISKVADTCLEFVYQICWQQLSERFGCPYHHDGDGEWTPTSFAVIGLGKLGGQDLNYSSDIDVVFVYDDEGYVFKTPPNATVKSGTGLTNHQFFNRLAEAFISEVGRITTDGFLYRIDLRLRPEGNAGPLARSLASYENYYAQWGQTWERMMLIKARRVAGDQELAANFIESVHSFRYPRSISERILREIAQTKHRIELEVVKAGEIDRNVKLGRGGIREIEFIIQTLQLLHAGRLPFLQQSPTLAALEKIKEYHLLTDEEAAVLHAAYHFLRDVEHRLQMEANLQTHSIPLDPKAQARLAILMGFPSKVAFERKLKAHTRGVRSIYDKILGGKAASPVPVGLPDFETGLPAWITLLEQRSFRDPQNAVKVLQSLVHGPGYIHVSSRTIELARELLPRFLEMCPLKKDAPNAAPPPLTSPTPPQNTGHLQPSPQSAKVLSDPDRVLARLDSFVTAYGARSTLLETWTTNPSLFELLLLLFDRSEFLAEAAIRVPDLVDDLVLSGRLRRSKTAAETLEDLQHGLEEEDQGLWIRRYHQAEFMRLGLREILGLADYEQSLCELTALADACLQYALEVTMRKHRLQKPPFAIIGLGKLGGKELTYGSDLDIVFVADPRVKKLAPLADMAASLMDLLSGQTALGIVFKTDARLRPDGSKGLLVNTLNTYEEYYRHRAMLWEIQTLSRTRFVAGDDDIGMRFEALAAKLTNFKKPSLPLSAYSDRWKLEIHKMRMRIEKERTPAGKQDLAFKTGTGGLMDAEFIAQMLCLQEGWLEPNTLSALEKARQMKVLTPEQSHQLIDHYRELLRMECILRRWSYEGESLLPDDPAPQYRVAVRCGFPDAPSFFKALAEHRRHIRQVYDDIFKDVIATS